MINKVRHQVICTTAFFFWGGGIFYFIMIVITRAKWNIMISLIFILGWLNLPRAVFVHTVDRIWLMVHHLKTWCFIHQNVGKITIACVRIWGGERERGAVRVGHIVLSSSLEFFMVWQYLWYQWWNWCPGKPTTKTVFRRTRHLSAMFGGGGIWVTCEGLRGEGEENR